MLQAIPEHKVFPKAPIKEAIVDISVVKLGDENLPTVESMHKHFSAEFPNQKKIRVLTQTLEINDKDEATNSTSNSLVGYQFWAKNELDLVTCRLDGFSYNKLKPYTKWADILAKTSEGWEFYKSVFPKVTVNKFSVRNINLIEIPERKFELNDYFNAAPNLPEGIDRPLENFLTRYVVDFAEFSAKCVITMATAQPVGEHQTSILFDIEAFRMMENTPSAAQIKTILTNLNDIKDLIFFKTITGKTQGLFE